MYQIGELLKFSPFEFKNGMQPKPKYCEQVDEYEQKYLDEMSSVVEHLGMIDPQQFLDLRDCIKKAKALRRKYRQLL